MTRKEIAIRILGEQNGIELVAFDDSLRGKPWAIVCVLSQSDDVCGDNARWLKACIESSQETWGDFRIEYGPRSVRPR